MQCCFFHLIWHLSYHYHISANTIRENLSYLSRLGLFKNGSTFLFTTVSRIFALVLQCFSCDWYSQFTLICADTLCNALAAINANHNEAHVPEAQQARGDQLGRRRIFCFKWHGMTLFWLSFCQKIDNLRAVAVSCSGKEHSAFYMFFKMPFWCAWHIGRHMRVCGLARKMLNLPTVNFASLWNPGDVWKLQAVHLLMLANTWAWSELKLYKKK